MIKRVFIFFTLILPFLSISALYAQDDVGTLLSRTNNLRASVGRPGYTLNGALSAAAQSQAQWIAETGNVSHTRPDGSGPRTRALAAGYTSAAVSENIYGGTNASADSAWNFWVNSGIHYAGLVHASYTEVGIGVARSSWGTAYVMVFGNPSGYMPAAVSSSGGVGSTSGGQQSAPAEPPSFILGVDEYGNIQHQVQPGDTLGDIALIYGYTWDDLPYMMQLNGLADVRDLEVGSIFLVPPKAGTYTPAPDANTATPVPTDPPAATATPIPPTITPFTVPTDTPVPFEPIATVGSEVTPPVADVIQVVNAPTPQPEIDSAPPMTATVMPARNNSSTWLMLALAVQVVVLIGAGIEFVRRRRK